MWLALRAKKKLGFMEGSIAKPKAGTVKKEEWWIINTMVDSWILNTIEPNLRTTMSYAKYVANCGLI